MATIKDLPKLLETNQVALFLAPKEKIKEYFPPIAESLWKKYKKVGVVSLASPYSTIMSQLEKAGINPDDFIFIDILTNTVRRVESTNSCQYIDHPSNLTDLAIALTGMLKKTEAIIINNPVNLRTFIDEATIIRFMESIVNKVRVANKKMLIVEAKDGNTLIYNKLLALADATIEEN